MSHVMLRPDPCALVVIDMQDGLLKSIHDSERVASRIAFLVRVARLLDIPILATEQNPAKLGPTHPSIAACFVEPAISKMRFSSAEALTDPVRHLQRTQLVLTGIETHICVSQTAQDFLESGYQVVVCADAVSASTLERHKLGMERIRDAGAVPAHTESVAYEWMGTADHPKFREMLGLVKLYP